MSCECRRFPALDPAQTAYLQVGATLAYRFDDPRMADPRASAFLMCDDDSPAAFVAIIGDDEHEVRLLATTLGGEPFELPDEHVAAMHARRKRVGKTGVPFAGFVYRDLAELNDDGSMRRF